jgi:predicted ATPase/DNA-binding SARP family transcriptional activator
VHQAIEVRALGALEVRRGGKPVTVPGAKPRTVLSLLALNLGRAVTAPVLAGALWAEQPPRTAHKALQTHISVIRRVLGDTAVRTRGLGWLLAVDTIDAVEFDAAVQAGRDALRRGDPVTADEHFSAALNLWRGPPELPPTPRAQAEITRWTEAREALVEDLVDARLAQGRAAELIGDLEAAVSDAPLRERRWAQLCLALYRAGRQGDALEAYRRAREVMSEQLGLEPGPQLRRLEALVLAHDPTLDVRSAAASDGNAATPPSQAAHRAGPALPVPVPPTAFVGRVTELATLRRLVAGHPLVTVTGPGGVGKTRLALATAASVGTGFPGGVAFADLASATPSLVVQTVAAALQVREEARQPLDEAIHVRLRSARTLLILDNCEHVLDDAAGFVGKVLGAGPDVVVLATSRERLSVPGEQVFTVPPLSLAGRGTQGTEGSDAAMLFLDRARAVDPEFDPAPEQVGELCARLDGLPLAIELAAARCASVGMDGLLAGLQDRLGLLSGSRGGQRRHRSLRAMLDWSHDLLDPDEQAVFRRLGLFVGPFDLSAARDVVRDVAQEPKLVDLIGRLTDKSLLSHVSGPAGSRWQMLEVVRSYANERLAASGEQPAARVRRLRWAADTARALERRLTTGEPWPDDFDAVADDLRLALFDDTAPDDGGHRLPLALALAHLYSRRGAFTIAQLAYHAATSMARESGDAAQLAQAALGASTPGMLFGVTHAGRVALLEEALAAQPAERNGDYVRLLARLATELFWSADRDRSRRLAREAATVAEQLGDDHARAYALHALQYVSRQPGGSADQLALAGQLVEVARRANETQLKLAGRAARVVGLLEAGDLPGMDAELAELAAAADRLGHPEFKWYSAVYQLVRALIAGRFDEADTLAAAAAEAGRHAPEFGVGLFFAEVVTDLRTLDEVTRQQRVSRLAEMADRFPQVFVWRCAAVVADLSQQRRPPLLDRLHRLVDELLGHHRRDDHWLVGCCLLAEAAAAIEDDKSARRLEAVLRPFADRFAVAGRVAAFRGSVSYQLGLLAHRLGDHRAAIADLERAVADHERMGARPFLARSLAGLAQVFQARGGEGDRERAVAARHRATAAWAGRSGPAESGR